MLLVRVINRPCRESSLYHSSKVFMAQKSLLESQPTFGPARMAGYVVEDGGKIVDCLRVMPVLEPINI